VSDLEDIRLSEPRYGIAQAAQYIRIPVSTLRAWVWGDDHVPPVLALPTRAYLSFINLIEAFVLHTVQRRYMISLRQLKDAIAYVEHAFQVEHPLAFRKFKTSGIDLFMKSALGSLDALRGRQKQMDAIMADFGRIEWAYDDRPVALFLLTGDRDDDSRRVRISPFVSFGKPVISGTGILTSIIAERFYAGEPVNELSRDYRVASEDIEEAVGRETSSRWPEDRPQQSANLSR